MPPAFDSSDVSIVEIVPVDDSNAEGGAPLMSAGDAGAITALSGLLDEVARVLRVPVALLSRDQAGWHFEGEAFPSKPAPGGLRFGGAPNGPVPGAVTDDKGSPWTGLIAGTLREREWLLMLPGSPDRWRDVDGLDDLIVRFGRSLATVTEVDDDPDRYERDRARRLYAFTRRLTRPVESAQLHRLILKTIARQIGAQTGAIAAFSEPEHALTITATHGYPLAIVEHVRILPGHGIMGEAFTTRRAVVGRRCEDVPRRLRYRTDSYLAVPLVAGGRSIAVVALTDRADGRPFDERDLDSARALAAPAALALARQRVSDSLDELTRAATVDPVTGLFNRRYFETRLQAEVQRARRQQQDLALLMVDIDDFKRINDTFGHLEGDRALRDVADQLRGGVRIFDVCARYGGEEFAIVMPGATRHIAVQVAERVRRGLEERTRRDPRHMTVSIGVGFLGPGESEEDVIASADRALIAAKRAGKNVVKTG
jgi:diguanylate cyclase (GGDEF)-like protein